jgi:hypothetical protein
MMLPSTRAPASSPARARSEPQRATTRSAPQPARAAAKLAVERSPEVPRAQTSRRLRRPCPVARGQPEKRGGPLHHCHSGEPGRRLVTARARVFGQSADTTGIAPFGRLVDQVIGPRRQQRPTARGPESSRCRPPGGAGRGRARAPRPAPAPRPQQPRARSPPLPKPPLRPGARPLGGDISWRLLPRPSDRPAIATWSI